MVGVIKKLTEENIQNSTSDVIKANFYGTNYGFRVGGYASGGDATGRVGTGGNAIGGIAYNQGGKAFAGNAIGGSFVAGGHFDSQTCFVASTDVSQVGTVSRRADTCERSSER
jgi:hypothetical protein